ncbi:hypothetical protein ACFLYM_01830 [Chloroflexota bacterium]
MNDWVIIAILVVVLLLALFVLPQFFIGRAMKKVIHIFRESNTIGERQAKTAEQLGLEPKGMIDRMMKPRDYKPRALQYLIGANIIQMTEDGKLYLVEENLANTKFANPGY